MNFIQLELPSLAPANPTRTPNSTVQRIGSGVAVVGFVIFLSIALGFVRDVSPSISFASIGLVCLGSLLYIAELRKLWKPGIRNNGVMFASSTHRGLTAWLIAVSFTLFYVILYWFPEYLLHAVHAFDPLSQLMRNKPADRWFLYGSIYTFAVAIMGIRFMIKYRHSRYQLVRTSSVVFFQTVFSWVIPSVLILMNSTEHYFSYFWPLRYTDLFPSTLQSLVNSPAAFVKFMGWWTLFMSFVGVPLLTYYFGKRWYCSFVCGCGDLAETVGDPFRHNSDKSLKAWRIERWMIHSILVWITTLTAILWIDSAQNGQFLHEFGQTLSKWYGFVIGAAFSGVIGVGFYPLMGSRVWCRFGCPQAAILGILQKYFSRFRITTNGAQCISCGNCSTYCEMGIDVRAYAQRGENIVRASCVGCGICSAVCPRGVLNLELGPVAHRTS